MEEKQLFVHDLHLFKENELRQSNLLYLYYEVNIFTVDHGEVGRGNVGYDGVGEGTW